MIVILFGLRVMTLGDNGYRLLQASMRNVLWVFETLGGRNTASDVNRRRLP